MEKIFHAHEYIICITTFSKYTRCILKKNNCYYEYAHFATFTGSLVILIKQALWQLNGQKILPDNLFSSSMLCILHAVQRQYIGQSMQENVLYLQDRLRRRFSCLQCLQAKKFPQRFFLTMVSLVSLAKRNKRNKLNFSKFMLPALFHKYRLIRWQCSKSCMQCLYSNKQILPKFKKKCLLSLDPSTSQLILKRLFNQLFELNGA